MNYLSPQASGDIELPNELAHRARRAAAPAPLATLPIDPEAEAETPAAAPSEEQLMARALKLGALFGIPGVFLVTGGVGYLGGAGLGPSVLIGAWCGFFGGGLYLGSLPFLPKGHEAPVMPRRASSAATTSDAAPPNEP